MECPRDASVTVLCLIGAVAITAASSASVGVQTFDVARIATTARQGTDRPASNATPVELPPANATPRLGEVPFARLVPDATLPIEFERGAVAADDAVWVPHSTAGAVVRIDPKANTAGAPIAVGASVCGALAVAFDSVWVPRCEPRSIVRVPPAAGNVSATLPLPPAAPEGALVSSASSIWVLGDPRGIVSRIDPATNAPVAEVFVAARPTAMAADDDVVWVTSDEGGVVTRVDAVRNLVVDRITVGARPGAVVVGEDGVWVLNRGDGSVSRIDSATNKVAATIPIGEWAANADLAVGEGGVWLSAPGSPLVRIDPRSNRVTHRFIGDGGGALLVAHGSIWIAAGPRLTWRVDPRLAAAMRP